MANIRHKGQTTRAGGGAPCCEEGERRAHFARGREVGEGARVGEGALFADARTQTREDGARAAREDRAARERPPRRARGARRAVRLGRGAISRAPARRAHPQRHKRHRGSHLQKRREGNRVLAGPPEDIGSPDPEGAPFWIFPAPCYISTGGSCGVAWTPLLVPPPPIWDGRAFGPGGVPGASCLLRASIDAALGVSLLPQARAARALCAEMASALAPPGRAARRAAGAARVHGPSLALPGGSALAALVAGRRDAAHLEASPCPTTTDDTRALAAATRAC